MRTRTQFNGDHIQSSAVCYTNHDPQVSAMIARLCQIHGWQFHAVSATELAGVNCDTCDPGCVVVDLDEESIHCDDLIDRFYAAEIFVPTIAIATEANIHRAVCAMRAGAYDFLPKPLAESELEETLVAAMKRQMRERELRTTYRQTAEQMATLSDGERQVLELLMEGTANKVIAAKLDIGLRTVEARRARALEKLHSKSLAEAVRKIVIYELQPVGLKKAQPT